MNTQEEIKHVACKYIHSKRTRIGSRNAECVNDRKNYGIWKILLKENNKWVNIGFLPGGHTTSEVEVVVRDYLNGKMDFNFDYNNSANKQ